MPPFMLIPALLLLHPHPQSRLPGQPQPGGAAAGGGGRPVRQADGQQQGASAGCGLAGPEDSGGGCAGWGRRWEAVVVLRRGVLRGSLRSRLPGWAVRPQALHCPSMACPPLMPCPPLVHPPTLHRAEPQEGGDTGVDRHPQAHRGPHLAGGWADGQGAVTRRTRLDVERPTRKDGCRFGNCLPQVPRLPSPPEHFPCLPLVPP